MSRLFDVSGRFDFSLFRSLFDFFTFRGFAVILRLCPRTAGRHHSITQPTLPFVAISFNLDSNESLKRGRKSLKGEVGSELEIVSF